MLYKCSGFTKRLALSEAKIPWIGRKCWDQGEENQMNSLASWPKHLQPPTYLFELPNPVHQHRFSFRCLKISTRKDTGSKLLHVNSTPNASQCAPDLIKANKNPVSKEEILGTKANRADSAPICSSNWSSSHPMMVVDLNVFEIFRRTIHIPYPTTCWSFFNLLNLHTWWPTNVNWIASLHANTLAMKHFCWIAIATVLPEYAWFLLQYYTFCYRLCMILSCSFL